MTLPMLATVYIFEIGLPLYIFEIGLPVEFTTLQGLKLLPLLFLQ